MFTPDEELSRPSDLLSHSTVNGTSSSDGEGGVRRKLSRAEGSSAERKISVAERRISSTKVPERKISVSKGPERKISSSVDPMYIHLSEDVDEEEEEEEEEEMEENMDLDDMYEDDEKQESGSYCCDEARINWSRFGQEMIKQGKEVKENFKKIDFKSHLRSFCSIEILKKRFPIIQWAPKYRVADLQGDIIAGTTVGLTVIPQSIAYAFIAGLPPQYGLYSAFIGSFVYVIFGSAKDIVLGPSAVLSLLTALFGTSPIENDASYAIILGFFSGIIGLFMSLLGLGMFMDFISYPVIKAFTSAAAITIAMSQFKKWFGQTGVPRDFMPQLYYTVAKIPEARLYDFILGVCCIALIVFLRKLKDYKWKKSWDELPLWLKIVNKIIWIFGTGRNIIAIVLASVVAYIFMENSLCPFTLTGYITPGIPPFQLPAFSVTDKTKNITYNLNDMSSSIGVGYIIVPVIGLIEAMSIGNIFARRNDYRIDANQELLTYGIGNFLNAMFSGYPITGTFSRTAVNALSGVRTPAGGIVTGVIVLLALQYLTPLFYYIPNASLAVVIILAVIDMITFHKLWIFWKTRKIDLIPWIVTFVLSFVVNIAYGVLIGTGLSLLLLLYPAWRPKIKIIKSESGNLLGYESTDENTCIIIVKFYNGLMYPAVEYMKNTIIPLYNGTANLPKGVIFDLHHAAVIDTTTVQGIRMLLESFNKNGIQVVFCNLQKSVDEILRRSKPKFFLKTESLNDAVRIILNPKPGSLKLPQTVISTNRNINNNRRIKRHGTIEHGQQNFAFQLSETMKP